MRRILFAAGWYVAGVATLPAIIVIAHFVSARSHAQPISQVTAEDVTAEGEAVALRVEKPDVRFQRQPPRSVAAPMPSRKVKPTTPPIELPDETSPTIADESREEIALPVEIAQTDRFDVDGKAAAETLDPFGSRVEFLAAESTVEALSGKPAPAAPQIVLPVGPETLAGAAPQDEAQVEQLKQLRDELKKVIEEKSAKLSAAALQTEIEMHRQHLSDLNALEELQKLEQSLKELSDKYPNSDSGRRANELLKVLELQRQHGTRRPVTNRHPSF